MAKFIDCSPAYNQAMRLNLPRFYVRELATNLAALERDVQDAAAKGADAIVFPEVFLTGYTGAADPQQVHAKFAELSARHPQLLCIFGTLTEGRANRCNVYLGGKLRAHYDKVHMFLPNREQELWDSGTCYSAFTHGDWRIGLAICNDVRFPEQSRALKLRCDVNLLVYPALWPWQRDHVWQALLRARAIENGCFAVGCSVAGVDNGGELFDGAGNYVFDPLGNAVHPDMRMYELDPKVLKRVTVDTRAQHVEIEDVRFES
jgi:predicted amidohydrolase